MPRQAELKKVTYLRAEVIRTLSVEELTQIEAGVSPIFPVIVFTVLNSDLATIDVVRLSCRCRCHFDANFHDIGVL
jgi:hypothetical protein